MALVSDFHNHVSRSSAEQMAQAAREKGLRVLGLSEHDFQMQEARNLLTHMPIEGQMLSFVDYIEAVHTAGRNSDVEVRLGLEVDFIPGKNDLIQTSLAGYPWDFLIGSVHEIDGKLFEYGNGQSREEGEQLWLRYFQLLREAVKSGYFSVISHPVRMRMKNPHVPATIDDELEQLAVEATRQNIALEINGSDMLTYPDLVRRLARACVLHHTPISVGSDAHRPPQVAKAHAQSEILLREAGINSVRTWKQGVPEEHPL
jgi:histidinol-phosphatase (PHP family)